MKRILPFLILLVTTEAIAQKKFEVDSFGYIPNPTFHQLIKKRRYDLVYRFEYRNRDSSMQYAWVEKNRKRGFIDQAGREVVEVKYRKLDYYGYGYGLYWGKWRKIEAPFYKSRMPAKYRDNDPIFRSLYKVHYKKKWFITNENGERLNDLEYDEIDQRDSYKNKSLPAYVRIYDKWGVIDSSGREIIPVKYSVVYYSDLSNTFIAEQNGKRGILGKNGESITSVEFDFIEPCPTRGYYIFKKAGKAGVLDSLGKMTIEPYYDRIYVQNDNQYNGYVSKVIKTFYITLLDKKYGILDSHFQEITPVKYDEIGEFSHHLARIKLEGKWGLINNSGKQLFPPVFDKNYNNTEYLLIKNDSNYSARMSADKLTFDKVVTGYWGCGLIIILNGKYGLMNDTGNAIISPEYDNIDCHDNMIFVRKGQARGLVDTSGRFIIPLAVQHIKLLRQKKLIISGNGDLSQLRDMQGRLVREINCAETEELPGIPYLLKIKSYGKYGIIDTGGRQQVPAIYEDIGINTYKRSDLEIPAGRVHDKFIVSKYSKWGLIDRYGKTIIPLNFDHVHYMDCGFYSVMSGKKYGVYDSLGKEITPFIYDEIYKVWDGRYLVKQNGYCGLLGEDMQPLCPVRYNLSDHLRNGYAKAYDPEYGGWTVIDPTGKEICAPNYTSIEFEDHFENSGLFIVKGKNRLKGFMDTSGKELTGIIYQSIKRVNRPGQIYPYYRVSQNDKMGIIDRFGNILFDIKFKELTLRDPGSLRGKAKIWTYKYDRYGNRKLLWGFKWSRGY